MIGTGSQVDGRDRIKALPKPLESDLRFILGDIRLTPARKRRAGFLHSEIGAVAHTAAILIVFGVGISALSYRVRERADEKLPTAASQERSRHIDAAIKSGSDQSTRAVSQHVANVGKQTRFAASIPPELHSKRTSGASTSEVPTFERSTPAEQEYGDDASIPDVAVNPLARDSMISYPQQIGPTSSRPIIEASSATVASLALAPATNNTVAAARADTVQADGESKSKSRQDQTSRVRIDSVDAMRDLRRQ
jgi:hypothetical protein